MKTAAIAAWIAILAVPGVGFAQSAGCSGLAGLDLTACLRSELDNGTASSGPLRGSTAGLGASGLGVGSLGASPSGLGTGTSTLAASRLGATPSGLGTSASGLSIGTRAIGSGSLAGPQETPGTFSRQFAPTSSFGLIPSTTSPSLTTPSLSRPLSTFGTTGTRLNSSSTGISMSRGRTGTSSSSSSGSLSTFDNFIGGTANGIGSDRDDPFEDDELLD